MSQRSGYEPGVPCWVDLSSTDVPASARFYGELFGWKADMIDNPEAGGYGQFEFGGKKVAGLGPAQMEGMPSVWNVYVATDDIQATARKVKDAGGTVIMDPLRVFDEGSMAVFQSPEGAFFCAWQANRHQGAELVNEPVSFTWNELAARDTEGAKGFFPAVFGWTHQTDTTSAPMPYTTWMVEGRPVAGMIEMGPQYPAEVPSHWATYFAVADTPATVDKAVKLGSTVIVPPMDSPMGPLAFLIDPQGAMFAIIQLNEAETA